MGAGNGTGRHRPPLRSWLRKLLLMIMDCALISFAGAVAVWLRFEFDWRPFMLRYMGYLPYVLLVYCITLVVCGMYRRMWRYAGIRDLIALVLMMSAGGFVTLLLNHFLSWGVSRAVLLVTYILSLIMIGGTRLAWRAAKTEVKLRRSRRGTEPVNRPRLMIVGAGQAASYVIRMCEEDPSVGVPVLLVDINPLKRNLRVAGVPVLGTDDDIPALVLEHGIQKIIIAIPSLRGERFSSLLLSCRETGCQVRMFVELRGDMRESGNRPFLRELNTADLLSRDEVHLDTESISAYLRGRRVLVTGGGGSIGSELCRQIIKYDPAELIIFDIYENGAYELLCELWRVYGRDIPVRVLIGSIRDRKRLDEVFEECCPQVVFHAAAHKHVPLLEDSPAEAVKNNIEGTRNVLEAAAKHRVERLVQLSTDKAVNPTNVMGATKRVTELMTQSFARHTPMKCMAVRFGNVLGSHGSVIPLFEQQIKNGGPVTITHPDMRRYFMTIPEAAQLVLQAGGIAESGAVFVLDMGESILIRELAEKMIRFYGYEPYDTIDIVYTGLRPGEKLYEELLTDKEESVLRRTAHDSVMIAPPTVMDDGEFDRQVQELIQTARLRPGEIVAALKRVVPEFTETPGDTRGMAAPVRSAGAGRR